MSLWMDNLLRLQRKMKPQNNAERRYKNKQTWKY